jgi:hypothetical protein
MPITLMMVTLCIETLPRRLLERDREQPLRLLEATLHVEATEAQPQGPFVDRRVDLFAGR